MYLPVANVNLIRIFLAVCCHNGLKIHQYDVHTAFISGIQEVLWSKRLLLEMNVDINGPVVVYEDY